MGSGAVRSRNAASNVARGIPAAAASGHKPSRKDRNAAASAGEELAVDGLGGHTGLFGCIELVKNRDTKEPMAPWNATPAQMDIMNQVAAKIRELGMYTFVRWNYIFICPPLTINKEEIDEGLAIISEAISIADKYVY